MSIKGWFTTFIYYDELQRSGVEKLNGELISDCYKIRAADFVGRKWCKKNYPGGYTSYSSIANLHQMSSTFMALEAKIRKHVMKYANFLEMDLKGKRIEMTDCWVNIMPEQVVHSLHLHPLSFISGTYYVKTPKDCSEIKFEDPRLSNFMAAPPKKSKTSDKNRQFVNYKPQAGKLVLFESWLRHGVSANQSEEDRISISFNYNWL